MVARIEWARREHNWSAARIEFESAHEGVVLSRRTVSRILLELGFNRRRLIAPVTWCTSDVKKVGRIPDGGGWRAHGRDGPEARAVGRTKKRGARRGCVYLYSAIDGRTRLTYTESLDDEKGVTAAEFLGRAKTWFAAHGITTIKRIVTDNDACYRSKVLAVAVVPARHQRITPYTPRHNGKMECCN